MRKITANLFISLDGVVEAPDQWHFPYFNDEMGAAVDATPTLGAADTILFGRKTYDSFAGAWPEREVQGDLVEAGTASKNEPGEGTIGMSGSVSLVRQLLAAGLLDELHLLVHPIAVRKGKRLFDEGETPIPLRLISSESFKTGVLYLVYAPADSSGDATYEDAKGPSGPARAVRPPTCRPPPPRAARSRSGLGAR